MTSTIKVSVKTAGKLVLAAARTRLEAANNDAARGGHDPLSAGDRHKANTLEAFATAKLEGEQAALSKGGELIPVASPQTPALAFKNTVADPNLITSAASRSRLELAESCRALELGLDLAETIGARDSMEKMLIHQMASIHSLTMMIAARATEALDGLREGIDARTRESITSQAVRMHNAAMRGSAEYQNGMTTLQRVRSGGKQSITVIHQNTQVNDGGQAVVTAGGGGRKRKGVPDENS